MIDFKYIRFKFKDVVLDDLCDFNGIAYIKIEINQYNTLIDNMNKLKNGLKKGLVIENPENLAISYYKDTIDIYNSIMIDDIDEQTYETEKGNSENESVIKSIMNQVLDIVNKE
jgi:hypothetical protein